MKAKLEIAPVKGYKEPRYPTKESLSANPAILYSVPKRWKSSPALYAALLFVVSGGLYACSNQNVASKSSSPTVLEEPSSTIQNTAGTAASAYTVPVFEHGSGRGSYGCSSVAPPVFLSEEEAQQVIREEAAIKGIDFSGVKTVEGTFPATNLYEGKALKDATWDGELELDGYDKELGFGFEFISQKDVADWQVEGNILSSVESYDMKGTAERLAASLQNTAVFYDPGENWEDFEWKASEADYESYIEQFTAEQKAEMTENLREQVRDFLAWLAAEGVI